ncbi:MAG: GNAT family N-acetyltransferase [Betaproteobacteria bacterium]|nr:GNAT family N-acetyltransferase [Betaproteobacteria bacterium]
MGNNDFNLPGGLAMRPATAADNAFLESLYRATRDDLRLADAEEDFIENLIELQHHAQTHGYGDAFPNAMYFVVEYHSERIGRVALDFGPNEIHVIDVALIPAARGKGYGSQVLQTIQATAAKVMAPVSLTVRTDHLPVKQLYGRLGFVVEAGQFPFERMVWYPPAAGIYSAAK